MSKATLAVQDVSIGAIKPYAKNPRKNEAAVAKVAASIKEFGWRQPIVVDEEMVVLAGHTRLLAAKRLGMATVPVHVATGLSPAKRRAFRLADNRTAAEAEWDDALLAQEIAALIAEGGDASTTGFDPDEIRRITAEVSQVLDGADLDEEIEPPAEPVTRPGDLWQLGRHRVLCGDSASSSDLARLMDGESAEVLWTDPPYGVDYVGKTKDALTIQNDTGDIGAFLSVVFGACDAVMAPGARFYVAAPPGPRHVEFLAALTSAGWTLHQSLVWVKDSMVLGHADYHYRHEPILYGWKPGPGRIGRGAHNGTRWYGDHSQTSVFDIPRPKRSAEHPTMKPVELVARCLNNSARPADVILDCFGGSGTTLLAAEVHGSDARLMEIAPAYCDVIVARWERATGKKAELVAP